MVRWFIKKKKHRYINGGKGVISIFLALLMIPFVVQADALIEATRYHAVASAVDGIMDSAATSVLSNYDSFLMKRFGLTAVSQSIDVESTYTTYYEANMEGSSVAWDTSSISVSGDYALSDVAVLENSVLEAAKYSVPTEMAGELFSSSISTLLKKLKNFDAICTAVSEGANAVGGMADVVTEYEGLKDAVAQLETDVSDYESKYSDFKNKVTELVQRLKDVETRTGELETARANKSEADSNVADVESRITEVNENISKLKAKHDSGEISDEEYEEKIEEYEDELSELETQRTSAVNGQTTADRQLGTAESNLESARSAVETARDAAKDAAGTYAESIGVVCSSLSSVETETEAVMSKLTSAASSVESACESINSATFTVSQSETDSEISKLQSEINELQNTEYASGGNATAASEQIAANNKLIEELQNSKSEATESNTQMKNTATEIKAGMDGISEALNEGLESYDSTVVDNCIRELETIQTSVNNFSVDTVTTSYTFDETAYHAQIQGIASKAALAAALETANNALTDEDENTGFWALVNGFSETMNGLFKINLFYDSKLDAVISSSSLATEANGLDQVIEALCALASDVATLSSTNYSLSGLAEKLNALKSLFSDAKTTLNSLRNYAVSIISSAASAVSQLSSGAYDKLLLAEYLNLSLSNRTTYKSKDILTGYSYSGILDSTANQADSIFVLGAFSALANAIRQNSGGSSSMFCGAETEYLIVGSRTEIADQAVVFMNIYLLRLVLDIIPILTNSQVQETMKAASAASAGVGGLLVAVFYICLEPFIDSVVIVNGNKIDFWKKCVYLTPAGIPTLITRLTSLGLTEDQNLQISGRLASALGTTYSSGATKDNKWVITADYSDYLLALLLFTDNNLLMKRFQNMISLEAAKNYGSFDINKSYTYIRASVTGQYVPFLSAAGIYTNFMFSGTRTQARGY